MAIRDILTVPDPRLREISEKVAVVDDEVRRLVDDMFETMYAAPGIGLAAIQIGAPRRIVTIDTARKGEDKRPMVFINPEVVWSSEDRRSHEEGCLSIPDYYEPVERPDRVRVRWLDRDGNAQEAEFSGLLSTCLQHEIDHLNGGLFIDYLSRLKRERVMKKFTKLARRAAE
ncbi:peptide deformylase [Blastochloris viridis]|uniref:Peptide deformylase n=1 Tax=Blastochloris viridis TaxID=1079 RepID=A0A0H5BPF8_BLAVI|nr:peptide deformylase [Blastochloris viridis]ALK10817.1 Peptide deformylase [Blastochloris viridis]BAR99213.1 peptide deformylase [Blastochloris viridis]CUU43479.1 Peptide deformylase [Blastochloris viridis]